MEGAEDRVSAAREEGRARRSAWIEATCVALLLVGFLAYVRYHSADVAGGADSYGYVSEAVRLAHGRLYEPERVLSPFGLAEDSRRTHPLGYLEKGTEGTVPQYPFGYPLLMAVMIRILGLSAAFWVTPLLAAGALLLTYLLGRATMGRTGGAAAAVFLGVTANFLWSAFQPLSDIPALFFCVLTLVALLALRKGPAADFLLGASLGSGVWVRPNLGLLVGVAGLWLAARGEWRRLLRAGFALAPFLAVEGFVNWHLFGAPWRSGYGELPLGGLLGDVLARGGRYLLRLDTQQAHAGLALLVLALIWNRVPLAGRLLMAGVFASFLCFFAFYRIDDAWWYFRFILPAMPAVAVLEAGFLTRLVGPGRGLPLRAAAVSVAVIAIAVGSLRYGSSERITGVAPWEGRYPKAAALVTGRIEKPALVLAMQHSGSLRFYTGLQTARYDLGSPQQLRETLRGVARAGGHLYLVVEDWELEKIRGSDRAFLLDGAQELGVSEPGHVALLLLAAGSASGRDSTTGLPSSGSGARR